jgi:tRNA(fMet)-specific endonuclease VapC
MIYLLDTDLFTLAHLGKHGLGERINTERPSHDIVISLVTRIEVLRGRFDAVLKAADAGALLRAQELLRSSESFLGGFRILPFDRSAMGEFDRLRKDKKTKKTSRNDLLIACIALAHNATLVTRNTKDFQAIPGLRLENWAD